MQYKSFEDLPVWQEAIELARSMYEFTALDPLRSHSGLRDQLEHATCQFRTTSPKDLNVERPTSF